MRSPFLRKEGGQGVGKGNMWQIMEVSKDTEGKGPGGGY